MTWAPRQQTGEGRSAKAAGGGQEDASRKLQEGGQTTGTQEALLPWKLEREIEKIHCTSIPPVKKSIYADQLC